MTHDQMCPFLKCIDTTCDECCCCNLIGKVREDEQENARKAVEAQAKRMIEIADIQAAWSAATAADDMLTKCLAVVESMRQAQSSTWTHGEYLSRRSVLAALRELLP